MAGNERGGHVEGASCRVDEAPEAGPFPSAAPALLGAGRWRTGIQGRAPPLLPAGAATPRKSPPFPLEFHAPEQVECNVSRLHVSILGPR